MLSVRTVRIFVSSTFSDMKVERDALQRRVFPLLSRQCAERGWQFQVVDLRWGVSEEAAHDQRTMRTCLKEVSRCQQVSPRPNFLILLGDRYGWRPLPEEIAGCEFEQLLQHVDAETASRLQWRNDQPATENGWYRRDDNIVVFNNDSGQWEPGMYVLQPRTDRFRDFSIWESEVERPLREALEVAALKLNLSEARRLKYGSSATEQEIYHGALTIPDASDHVVAVHREWTDERGNALWKSDAEGRTAPSLLENPIRQFLDLDTNGRLDTVAHARQHALVDRLTGHLKSNLVKYRVAWQRGEFDEEYLDRFCSDVRVRLERCIQRQIEAHTDPALEGFERQQQADFETAKTSVFFGREQSLHCIADYVSQAKSGRPLVVLGQSGSGKSALLARAAEDARRLHTNAHVLVRYIGASAESTDIVALLDSLCRELSDCYTTSNEDLHREVDKLIDALEMRLKKAHVGDPLILFLDGLDQLTETHDAQELKWLPINLPENVRVVVSAIAPGEKAGRCGEVLTQRLPRESLMELPPLNTNEAVEMFEALLALEEPSPASGCGAIQRALSHDQRSCVAAGLNACSTPLYVRIVATTAASWTSWHAVHSLPTNVVGVLESLFERLSDRREHGPLLTSRVLSLLHCARQGLREDEIFGLLQSDPEYWNDFLKEAKHVPTGRQLPSVVWLRLYYDLQPYLTNRSTSGGTLLTFFHRQLADAVESFYFNAEPVRRAYHAALAEYFRQQPLYLQPPKGDGTLMPARANLRKLAEFAYQLLHSDQNRELISLFEDHAWFHAWYKGSDQRYDGYLGDMDLAWNGCAVLSINEPVTTLLCRTLLAFLRTSINSLVDNVDPSLIAPAIATGLWSFDRGFSFLEKIQNKQRRITAGIAIIEICTLTRHEMQAIVRVILVSEPNCEQLCRLASKLEGELFTTAWNRLKLDLYNAPRSVTAFGFGLSQDQLTEVLNVAVGRIEAATVDYDQPWKKNEYLNVVHRQRELSRLLVAMAPFLDGELLNRAASLAEQIPEVDAFDLPGDWGCARDYAERRTAIVALKATAQGHPAGKTERKDDPDVPRSGVAVTSRLSQAEIEDHLEAAASKVPDLEQQSRVLLTVFPRTSGDVRVTLLNHCLSQLRSMRDPIGMCKTLAPCLQEAEFEAVIEAVNYLPSPKDRALSFAVLGNSQQLVGKHLNEAIESGVNAALEIPVEASTMHSDGLRTRIEVLMELVRIMTGRGESSPQGDKLLNALIEALGEPKTLQFHARSRAETLLQVAKRLGDRLFERGLSLMDALLRSGSLRIDVRTNFLTEVTAGLSPDSMSQFLEAISKTTDPAARASLLAVVCSRYEGPRIQQAAIEGQKDVQSLYGTERVRANVAFAPHLDLSARVTAFSDALQAAIQEHDESIKPILTHEVLAAIKPEDLPALLESISGLNNLQSRARLLAILGVKLEGRLLERAVVHGLEAAKSLTGADLVRSLVAFAPHQAILSDRIHAFVKALQVAAKERVESTRTALRNEVLSSVDPADLPDLYETIWGARNDFRQAWLLLITSGKLKSTFLQNLGTKALAFANTLEGQDRIQSVLALAPHCRDQSVLTNSVVSALGVTFQGCGLPVSIVVGQILALVEGPFKIDTCAKYLDRFVECDEALKRPWHEIITVLSSHLEVAYRETLWAYVLDRVLNVERLRAGDGRKEARLTMIQPLLGQLSENDRRRAIESVLEIAQVSHVSDRTYAVATCLQFAADDQLDRFEVLVKTTGGSELRNEREKRDLARREALLRQLPVDEAIQVVSRMRSLDERLAAMIRLLPIWDQRLSATETHSVDSAGITSRRGASSELDAVSMLLKRELDELAQSLGEKGEHNSGPMTSLNWRDQVSESDWMGRRRVDRVQGACKLVPLVNERLADHAFQSLFLNPSIEEHVMRIFYGDGMNPDEVMTAMIPRVSDELLPQVVDLALSHFEARQGAYEKVGVALIKAAVPRLERVLLGKVVNVANHLPIETLLTFAPQFQLPGGEQAYRQLLQVTCRVVAEGKGIPWQRIDTCLKLAPNTVHPESEVLAAVSNCLQLLITKKRAELLNTLDGQFFQLLPDESIPLIVRYIMTACNDFAE